MALHSSHFSTAEYLWIWLVSGHTERSCFLRNMKIWKSDVMCPDCCSVQFLWNSRRALICWTKTWEHYSCPFQSTSPDRQEKDTNVLKSKWCGLPQSLPASQRVASVLQTQLQRSTSLLGTITVFDQCSLKRKKAKDVIVLASVVLLY